MNKSDLQSVWSSTPDWICESIRNSYFYFLFLYEFNFGTDKVKISTVIQRVVIGMLIHIKTVSVIKIKYWRYS